MNIIQIRLPNIFEIPSLSKAKFSISNKKPTQPTFQRRINVADPSSNNAHPTLKMKKNPTSHFQRWATLI